MIEIQEVIKTRTNIIGIYHLITFTTCDITATTCPGVKPDNTHQIKVKKASLAVLSVGGKDR